MCCNYQIIIYIILFLDFSAVRCTNSNCTDGYLLPQNSLDSNSTWTCQYLEPKLKQGCGIEMSSEDISKLVEEIEEVSWKLHNLL